jgi:hypothetical protein
MVFLTSDHEEAKGQYKEDDWLLYFLGSNEAGQKPHGNRLEYNVKIIITILYSILCSTRDYKAIDVLARSLGSNIPSQRRRYLNQTAIGIVKDFSK